MKILHLCTTNRGGAGQVAELTHRECLRQGHQSVLLVRGDYYRPDTGIIPLYARWKNIWRKLAQDWRKVIGRAPTTEKRYYFYNLNEQKGRVPARSITKRIGFIPDAIAIFWTSGFINTVTIRELYEHTGAEIRFFLTDMAAYTGGCHYAWECTGYQQACQACPALPANNRAQAAKNLAIKLEAIADIPYRVIVSRGQALAMANQSRLFRQADIIPNVLRVSHRLQSVNRIEARKQLGLPEHQRIWLIGAEHLNDPRKGMDLLIEALGNFQKASVADRPLLLIIGRRAEALLPELPLSYLWLGQLDFTAELPLAFIAADAYLSPSIMDTGPFMVNLAIFYGCPVVAFRIGVARYLLAEYGCGILAETTDALAYGRALHQMFHLPDHEREAMRSACIKVAKAELCWKDGDVEYLLSSTIAKP